MAMFKVYLCLSSNQIYICLQIAKYNNIDFEISVNFEGKKIQNLLL
jgi:hypothetical protein